LLWKIRAIVCKPCSSKDRSQRQSKTINHSRLRARALRAAALTELALAYALTVMPHASAQPAFWLRRPLEQPTRPGALPEKADSAPGLMRQPDAAEQPRVLGLAPRS